MGAKRVPHAQEQKIRSRSSIKLANKFGQAFAYVAIPLYFDFSRTMAVAFSGI
jgi:hypothetical protein